MFVETIRLFDVFFLDCNDKGVTNYSNDDVKKSFGAIQSQDSNIDWRHEEISTFNKIPEELIEVGSCTIVLGSFVQISTQTTISAVRSREESYSQIDVSWVNTWDPEFHHDGLSWSCAKISSFQCSFTAGKPGH